MLLLSTKYIAAQLATIAPIANAFAKNTPNVIITSAIVFTVLLVYGAKVGVCFDNYCQSVEK